jgi:hypothetical protein
MRFAGVGAEYRIITDAIDTYKSGRAEAIANAEDREQISRPRSWAREPEAYPGGAIERCGGGFQ